MARIKHYNHDTKQWEYSDIACAITGSQSGSGVYVGSGEMPENCNVKIDPNGEGLDIWTEIKNYLDELGVGSSKPDITLRGIEYGTNTTGSFSSTYSTNSSTGYKYGPDQITFDQEEIVSAYEKLLDREAIRCALIEGLWLDSWRGAFNSVFYSVKTSVSKEYDPKLLFIEFKWESEFDGYLQRDACELEYIFEIDTENRTATLSKANSVAIE